MLDTYVTVVGNLVADPRLIETDGRPPMASFRLASTPRRFDRRTGEWRDGETLFTNVTCWRGLAENVMLSLKKGNGVIVHGRLMKRGYETKAGEHRESVDIDALAVGPELSRVATVIKRVERSSAGASSETAASFETAPVEESTAAVADASAAEYDAALPMVDDDPELEGDLGEEGETELSDDSELAGAGAGSGGRLRSRFGIG